jgi:hypothetical protein
MSRTLCVAVAIAVWLPAGALAQRESPEAVAGAYYSAVRSATWAEVARLTHSRTQEKVRSAVLSAPPADSSRGSWPLVSQDQVIAGLGVRNLAEARELGSRVLLERLLSRGLPNSVRSVLVGTENESDTAILGHVAEGDSLVHVVRRARFVGSRPELPVMRGVEFDQGSRMDVITLMRDGEEWRVVEESGFKLLLMIRTLLGPG